MMFIDDPSPTKYQEIFLKAQTSCTPSEDTSGTYFTTAGTAGGFDHPEDCLTSYLLFGSPNQTWVSFENVTIPAGATIGKAWLEITSTSTESSTFTMSIYGVLGTSTYDCGTFGSMTYGADSASWSLTPWTAASTYTSPNIGCLIQNIVDDASWPSVGGVNMTFAFTAATSDTRVADIDAVTLKVYYDGASYGYGYNCGDGVDCSSSPCGCTAPDCTASGEAVGTQIVEQIATDAADGTWVCGSFCSEQTLMLGDYQVIASASAPMMSAQAVSGDPANIWLRFTDIAIPTPTATRQVQINQAFLSFNCKTADTAGVTDGDVVVDIYCECGDAGALGCFTGTHPSDLPLTATKKTWTIDYSWNTVNQVYNATELACLVQERVNYDWTTGDNITFLLMTDATLTASGATRVAYDKYDVSSYEPRLTIYYQMVEVADTSGGVLGGGSASVSTIYADSVEAAGVVIGGNAEQTKFTNEVATGGLLAAGLTAPYVIANKVASGVILAGGSSPDFLINVLTASGGAVVAGLVLSNHNQNLYPSGGIVAYGFADVDNYIISSGGLWANGAASISGTQSLDSSGGITAGGTAINTVIVSDTASGNLEAAGSAIYGSTYTSSASLTGTASLDCATAGLVGGSATLAATSTLSAAGSVIYKTDTASGGLLISGVGTNHQSSTDNTSGGIVAAGSGSVSTNHSASASLSASATLEAETITQPYVSGGLGAAGLALVSHDREFISGGGIVTGGHGVITNLGFATLSATSSMTVSTLAIRGCSATLAASSSLSASGSVITSPVCSGGLVCSGAAIQTISSSTAAEDGLEAAGSAIVTVNHSGSATLSADSTLSATSYLTHSGSGGAVLAGAAAETVSSVDTAAAFGLLGSGTATVTTDYRSITATLSATSSLSCRLGIKPKHVLVELHNYLLADDDLADLVDDRIYYLMLPENIDLPAISIQRISHEHAHDLDSASGFANCRVQFDCWSEDFQECKQISETLREMLQGFSGYFDSLHAMSIVIENENHLHEKPNDASDQYLFHIALDAMILHDETVPLA